MEEKDLEEIENLLKHANNQDPVNFFAKLAPILSTLVAVLTIVGGIAVHFFAVERQVSDLSNRQTAHSDRMTSIEKKVNEIDMQGTRYSTLREAIFDESIKNIQKQLDDQAETQKQLQNFLQHHDEEMKSMILHHGTRSKNTLP